MTRFVSTLLLCALAGASTTADAGTLWRVGAKDNIVTFASNGANEFTATGGWSANVVFPISTPGAKIESPNAPGYLSQSPATCMAQACTNSLTIAFDIVDGQIPAGADVILQLSRYGSDHNDVYLDGDYVGSVSGREELWTKARFLLNASLDVGPHTVEIRYTGGGADNGNFLDYIHMWTE